ncbi:hypothetical protein TYRP_005829 [Tyrophagus putrescentiae]|nr:hypothetical protein TYRP_005829 [Tyrophagus putrescentiae]
MVMVLVAKMFSKMAVFGIDLGATNACRWRFPPRQNHGDYRQRSRPPNERCPSWSPTPTLNE